LWVAPEAFTSDRLLLPSLALGLDRDCRPNGQPMSRTFQALRIESRRDVDLGCGPWLSILKDESAILGPVLGLEA